MHWQAVTREDALSRVDATWEQWGKKVRATADTVWVRTLPFERQTKGGIYLAPKLQGFYGELPQYIHIRGIVLSAGPKGGAEHFQVGDLIEFGRLHFAHIEQLNAETQEYVGWVRAVDVLWTVDHDGLAEQSAGVG